MSDEQEVVNGETPGEQPAPEVETAPADETPETPSAGESPEQKAGDACKCLDGRPGTLSDQEGQLVCLPNQG